MKRIFIFLFLLISFFNISQANKFNLDEHFSGLDKDSSIGIFVGFSPFRLLNHTSKLDLEFRLMNNVALGISATNRFEPRYSHKSFDNYNGTKYALYYRFFFGKKWTIVDYHVKVLMANIKLNTLTTPKQDTSYTTVNFKSFGMAAGIGVNYISKSGFTIKYDIGVQYLPFRPEFYNPVIYDTEMWYFPIRNAEERYYTTGLGSLIYIDLTLGYSINFKK